MTIKTRKKQIISQMIGKEDRVKALKIIIALFFFAILASCSQKADFSLRVNGVSMPNEVQNVILSDAQNRKIQVSWYFYRMHNKTIRSQGMSEVVSEKQPLDFQMPKKLSSDTTQVGINILVYNPYFLRFRIVMSDPKERKVYEGIRDYYEVTLNGSIAKDRQYQIGARVDLMEKNGSFVVDSANIEDLTYSIDSSKAD